jgi:hypothetical protein
MDLNLPASGQTVQQTFSVFDYDTGKYRYYVAPAAAPSLTGNFRNPRGPTPEALALAVPPHAKVVGEGIVPKGIIASLGAIESRSTSRWGIAAGVTVAVLALVAWRGRK